MAETMAKQHRAAEKTRKKEEKEKPGSEWEGMEITKNKGNSR